MPSEAQTFPALLRAQAESCGDAPALVTEDGSISYRELDGASALLASTLLVRGVTKGSRVGLLMENGIDWAVAASAVMRVGAVLVPLSTLLRPPELERQLRLSAVAHLILVEAFRGRDYLADLHAIVPSADASSAGLHAGTWRRDPALPALRNVWRWSELRSLDRQGDDTSAVALDALEVLEGRVAPANDLVVIFTSGSRAAPKGVVHTHGGALRATAAGLEARRLDHGERLYLPMPFFWVGGFGTGLLSALVAGATLVTEAAPDPERTLRLLEREWVTLFRGWPDQAARLAAHPAFADADLSRLRTGSLDAVLPAELRAPPGARPTLFGMTESFGPYCGDRLDLELPVGKHGSCGRPFRGMSVRIVEPERGTPVAPGVSGVIQLRSPNLMRAICGRRRDETFTPDGWYPTGDLGYLDADGYFFFTGRADDMFKVRGATVYPSEVEDALQSIPEVRRAAVIAVEDESGAREVGAAVVLGDEKAISVTDLVAETRRRLSAFKVPTRWAILSSVSDLPTSATGKLDVAGLRQLLDEVGIPSIRARPGCRRDR